MSMDIGLSDRCISSIERNSGSLYIQTLKEIAEYFDATPSIIVHGNEELPTLHFSSLKIGERIRELRISKGLTVRAFSKHIGEADSGCKITAWEKGRNEPLVKSLIDICDAFQVNIESLIQ